MNSTNNQFMRTEQITMHRCVCDMCQRSGPTAPDPKQAMLAAVTQGWCFVVEQSTRREVTLCKRCAAEFAADSWVVIFGRTEKEWE